MYLKAIEAVGFKSFADRVRMELKPGITGVVGPNGCGKSNIVDSIRWCVGEMSWKSLRSSSMVDIIFGGTASRPPLHMAEVSLIFDNESKRLPIDFTEVTVSRKIFRSGESEYFLNKVQCRLRDIREMFLDTGIGGEGYAIIDQGGVEFVLSASPEERRELFEEAAGVSKYKAKRDEALKKLEKVDQDMGRLADSIVLIEEQIKKLDSEARKARLHQKYKEELEAAEVAMLLGDMDARSGEIEKENTELSPLKQRHEDAGRELSAAEGELSALNLRLSEKQAEARKFGETIAAIKYGIGQLEGKIFGGDRLTAEIQKHLSRLDEEEKRHSGRLEQIDPEIQTAQSRLNDKKNGIGLLETEYEQKSSEVRSMEVEMENLQRTLDRADSELTAMAQTEIELSKQTATEESGLTHDRDSLLSLEKELGQKNSKSAVLNQELSEAKSRLEIQRAGLADAKSGLDSAENRKKELLQKLEKLNSDLSEAKAQKSGAAARLEAVLAQGNKDSYWVGTQSVLNSGIQGVKGTLRRAIEVKSEDRLRVEEAFGRFLDSVVCETTESAGECINYLKHLGKGRCRFLVLNAVPEAADPAPWGMPEGAGLLKSKISCPPEYERLVTCLLKNVFISEGSVRGPFWLCGGAEDAASPEPYWGEEGELTLRIKSLEDSVSGISAETASREKERDENEVLLCALREKVNAETIKEHTLSLGVGHIEETLNILAQELKFNSDESAGIRAEIEQRNGRLEALRARMQGVKSSQEEKKNELEGLKSGKNALHGDYSRAMQSLGEIRSNLENMRGSLQMLGAEVTRLENEKNELAVRMEKNSQDRRDSQERIAQLAQDKEKSAAGLSASRDELAGQETQERKVLEDLNALQGEFDSRKTAADVRKSAMQEFRDNIHSIELRINSSRTHLDDAARRLAENWNMTPEQAREKYSGVTVDHDRVNMMRRRLENMGPVNMTAPEEYEALTARDNFLKGQVADLNKAKDDLKSAIARINATTRENFRHTFDRVREHFIRIYGILFEGGEADIRLTQPDNLLETGIDIFAQPPGKRLQNISQLSGGEKALTALALLFSFFCVNPSPFCIMDEADAPLDEANVERFVGLIREFSKQTQFIVITHNKRTMEATDVLYGVTMEQAGVSQLISVSLQKPSGEKSGLPAEKNVEVSSAA